MDTLLRPAAPPPPNGRSNTPEPPGVCVWSQINAASKQRLGRSVQDMSDGDLGAGTAQHGLSSKKMALITSYCGTPCYPNIKWPYSPRVMCPSGRNVEIKKQLEAAEKTRHYETFGFKPRLNLGNNVSGRLQVRDDDDECLFDPRWALTYGLKPSSTLARCNT